MSPAIRYLHTEGLTVLFIEFGNRLKILGTLGSKGAFFQKWENVIKVVLLGILRNILEKPVLRDAIQRVFDPEVISLPDKSVGRLERLTRQ